MNFMSLILGNDKRGSIFDDRRKGERRKTNIDVDVNADKRLEERRKSDQKIKHK